MANIADDPKRNRGVLGNFLYFLLHGLENGKRWCIFTFIC